MIKNFPKTGIKAILQSESTYNAAERERVAKMIIKSLEFLSVMRQLIYGRTPFWPRLTGYRNDLNLMATMGKLPLEDIQCPTLVAHWTADGDVPFSHAEAAANSIPNAQLFKMEGVCHLLWLSENADEMVQAQVEFVKAHL